MHFYKSFKAAYRFLIIECSFYKFEQKQQENLQQKKESKQMRKPTDIFYRSR